MSPAQVLCQIHRKHKNPPFLVVVVTSPANTAVECTIAELTQTSESVQRVWALGGPPHLGHKSP